VPKRNVWQPNEIAMLIALREENASLQECSDRIGYGYIATMLKARELGIADRRNVGVWPGRKVKEKNGG
jgi:hypothetical protein